MKSLIQTPVSKFVLLRKVENDKPLVGGILCIMVLKKCKTCQVEKQLEMFSRHTACKMGLNPHCKECVSIRNGFVINNTDDLFGEVWKDVIGWEGYYRISSKGRLKRVFRRYLDAGGRLQNLKEKIISPWKNNGYWHYRLKNSQGFIRATMHRLVAIAFIPNPENKSEVNHKNRDRSDNRIENLEWVTRSENAIHAHRLIKEYKLKHSIY